MCKKFGIKVEEFGFGIPPRVWGKKIGETLYSLNLIPLGGFVRPLGEDQPDETSKKLSPRDFRAKPVGQRIIVVAAGVVMNLFLAWIIFYGILIYQNFTIIYPSTEPGIYIGRIEKGFPAEGSGISVGDQLISVNGQKVSDFTQAKDLIKNSQGKNVFLNLTDLDNKTKTVSLSPKKDEKTGYLIGVVFSPVPFKQYTKPIDKIFSGITYSFDLTKETFTGFGKIISDLAGGKVSQVSKSVSGPVGMAGMTNDILSAGPSAIPFYLWFVGIISLTLAIFNVLPIPALDGGRLLFLVIEAVTGKKVHSKTENLVHQVGFIVLLGLAALVTFSDIRKLIP